MGLKNLRTILLVIFIVTLLMLPPLLYKKISSDNTNICKSEYLGKQVIIDGDTLTIVKCGQWVVVLSNRTEVDRKIIDQFIIQK